MEKARKALGIATTNILLFAILILVFVVLLAVARLGILIQNALTPRVYTRVERIVVTPTPVLTASPAAGLKNPTRLGK